MLRFLNVVYFLEYVKCEYGVIIYFFIFDKKLYFTNEIIPMKLYILQKTKT